MRYSCGNQRRLQAVAEAGLLNAISFLEVSDRDAPTHALRQRTLFLSLLHPPVGLTAADVLIDGGIRYPTVGVLWAAPGDALPAGESPTLLAGVDDPSMVLVVRTDGTGDHSTYTLRLVAAGTEQPPAGFDPQLATIDFSVKVECPSDFDCQQDCFCPHPNLALPAINYLAKDFGSLRQLMLDRMSLLAPGWSDRHSADLGVALVEALAYVGDQLSYRQDAIATEAYLGTARSRISLRRHARLVDYQVSEGCNARAYVQIAVNSVAVPVPAGTQLLTAEPRLPDRVDPNDPVIVEALDSGTVEVFETVTPAVLDADLGTLHLWTWGQLDYCLPVGCTSATLRADHPTLRAGDVLILLESVSPTSGNAADADPTHRVAVRLTSVVTGTDPSGGRFDVPPTNNPVPITTITWDAGDALTFPLCVTAKEGQLEVGLALGNIVLADHGRTVGPQPLGPVPAPHLHFPTTAHCGCTATTDGADAVPVRFRPVLPHGPLSFVAPPQADLLFSTPAAAAPLADLAALNYTPAVEKWLAGHGQIFTTGPATVRGVVGDWSVSDGATVLRLTVAGAELTAAGRQPPASAALLIDPRTARPALDLVEDGTTIHWKPEPDLLASGSTGRDVVVEIDTDGSAKLRFGDGEHGRRPPTGLIFDAGYRIGNGTAGNVGAAAIRHLISADAAIVGVSNPMPAAGGVDLETAQSIRRDAPQAYLVQERAVTEADYATVAGRTPGVSKAEATFRWTGSWHTAFVTADRVGGGAVDPVFESRLVRDLNGYRMAGYDLDVNGPVNVALNIEVRVCVLPGHLRGAVHRVLSARLGSGIGPDGVRGLFHPDNFTFGQPVYLSTIYAAAQRVPGVQSVTVPTFERLLDDAGTGLRDGLLTMGRLEIALCANDPNFPDRGVLTISLGGGR